jgi:glutathione-independent formaldehyde dehydrogenase
MDIGVVTMKAVVYKGPGKVAVEEVDDPKISSPTDAIVRITSSAICGSDLHMYDGHTVVDPGTILGHEPMGVVEKVGNAIDTIKVGDRVVIPFNIACGTCLNCIRGYTSACLTMNPKTAGAAYGFVGMGPYRGAQAEMLLVPKADWACLKLPGKPGDDKEDDFVLLADIFPTGYHATELAKVSAGKSVAVFGAGSVGLLAAYSSILKGANDVYVVDWSKKRLDLAKSIGAIPINFTEGDPVKQIKDLRKESPALRQFPHPQDKLDGVDCVIDAVGYQAYDKTDQSKFNPDQVISDAIKVANPTGHLGIIGVYVTEDPKGKTLDDKKGILHIPFGMLWGKGLTMGTGQAPVKSYQAMLRDLIVSGKAKPSFIVSDHIKIDEAPEAYKEFDERDELVKAVIRFK